MIPKVVHYCWFGQNSKSDLIQKCIESWKHFLPDYKFIEWNDDFIKNCDNQYATEAYKEKKYAFVADYVRLKVLYDYGGIYLDTDIEVFKNFDKFLILDYFSGFEKYENKCTPCLSVIGAKKQHKIVGDLLNEYDNLSFYKNEKLNLETNTIKAKRYFSHNYNLSDKCDGKQLFQISPSEIIFPYYYFCIYEGEKTYAKHYFDASWLPINIKKVFSLGTYTILRQKGKLNNKIKFKGNVLYKTIFCNKIIFIVKDYEGYIE